MRGDKPAVPVSAIFIAKESCDCYCTDPRSYRRACSGRDGLSARFSGIETSIARDSRVNREHAGVISEPNLEYCGRDVHGPRDPSAPSR